MRNIDFWLGTCEMDFPHSVLWWIFGPRVDLPTQALQLGSTHTTDVSKPQRQAIV